MALDLFEIGKKRGPPPIIEIVAYATVAGAAALTAPGASKRMLDRHPLAKPSAAGRGMSESAQALLQLLVVRDRDRASMTE